MIHSIKYNWFYIVDEGEGFTTVTAGDTYNDKTCEKIEQHMPQGEGDICYYDSENI